MIFFLFAIFSFSYCHGYHWFIIDHYCTNISNIPMRYFESARENYAIHLGYNMYGTQVIAGMQSLQDYQRNHYHGEREERYFYLFHFELSDGPTPQLPKERRVPRLRLYAGCPPNLYCGPEDYFRTDESRAKLRKLLKTKLFDYSIFFWGGQLKDMNLKEVQDYLDTLDKVEKELRRIHGINIRLIYTTDHLPGSSDQQTTNMYPVEDRRRLHVNNRKIREFCNNFHKYLFDIADIESHTEDGVACYTNSKFRDIVYLDPKTKRDPTFVECNATYGNPSHCPMSNGQICNRKARAFWYLLARIAGYRPYNFIVLIVVGIVMFFVIVPPFFCGIYCIFHWTWGYHLLEKDPDDPGYEPQDIKIQDIGFPERILFDHIRDLMTRPVPAIRRLYRKYKAGELIKFDDGQDDFGDHSSDEDSEERNFRIYSRIRRNSTSSEGDDSEEDIYHSDKQDSDNEETTSNEESSIEYLKNENKSGYNSTSGGETTSFSISSSEENSRHVKKKRKLGKKNLVEFHRRRRKNLATDSSSDRNGRDESSKRKKRRDIESTESETSVDEREERKKKRELYSNENKRKKKNRKKKKKFIRKLREIDTTTSDDSN